MAQVKKPFAVKGFNVTSPIGEALWCKPTELDTEYNAKGCYQTQLVLDPNEATTKAFIAKLDEVIDIAYNEAMETLGVKGKGITKAPVFKDHIVKVGEDDYEETGNIVVRFKMNNVADRQPGQNYIQVKDAKKQDITSNCPDIGNGSKIRCVAFANPYYMASNKTIGISLIWTKMQLLDLVEYEGGDSDFDDYEGGYVAGNTTNNTADAVEDDLDF